MNIRTKLRKKITQPQLTRDTIMTWHVDIFFKIKKIKTKIKKIKKRRKKGTDWWYVLFKNVNYL